MTLGPPPAPPETASMRTRDGVRLDADLYRPPGEGPWPVLLLRQAYGRRIASTLAYAHPAWYAAQGYLVVVQDVRGRGTSEGTFRAFETEAEDGADAIAWAAGLEGSTGAVGMYGFSYQGVNQLLAAAEAPAALKAIAPAMASWDIREDWAYEGGAFNLMGSLGWAIQLAAENARLAGDVTAFNELHALSRGAPLGAPNPARPEFMARHAAHSHYGQWLDAPADGGYWRAVSPSWRADAIAAQGLPCLIVGGWFDSHLPGSLANYFALAGHSPTRLVVGPWGHFPWGRRVAGYDFGPDAANPIDRLQIRWFDHWLKGIDNGIAAEPPVRLFDMGANRWRDFDAWPAADTSLHLQSDGRAANSEDGRLSPTPATEAGVDHLVHDPWRPAPTVGGSSGWPGGPIERSAVDDRPDVLTYTTAPMDAPFAIAGSAQAELHVLADAPHFDIACILSRVDTGGRVYQIAEGYRSGPAPAAGEPVAVSLRATCATINPGEALRLSVAAASFPAHPVNPGDGRRPEDASLHEHRIITLGVRSGPGAASRLILYQTSEHRP